MVNNNQIKIYVDSSLKKGYSLKQIERSLISAGYDPSKIKKILLQYTTKQSEIEKYVKQQVTEKPEPIQQPVVKKKFVLNKKLLFLVGGFILVAVIVLFFIFFYKPSIGKGELLVLEEDYKKCKKIDNPYCIALVSEDEKKCDAIKDEKYKEYYEFIENYQSNHTKQFEKEVSHCKNSIKMTRIFLKEGDCTEVTEIDKKACEELLVLRDLNNEEFSNYCKEDCPIIYYWASAIKTKDSEECNKLKNANQRNMCKALVTNNPGACKELCDIVYKNKLKTKNISVKYLYLLRFLYSTPFWD